MRAVFPHRLALVKRLHDAGVPLVTGTDLANPFLVPGFSLHDEMDFFAEAGIPAAGILRAATLEAARLCGVEETRGTVAEGKADSLLLLRKNPLEDVRHAREIEGVFHLGEYRPRARLDEMLAAVASELAAARPEAKPQEIQLTVPGEVIRRGRYSISFGGMDSGVEDFVIARDDDGYHVQLHNQPKAGVGQVASITTFHAGPDFAFRRAEWKQLSQVPLVAIYERDGDKLRATARQGEAEPVHHEVTLRHSPLIEGPGWALQFISLGLAGLDVGEKKEFHNVWFGYPSWKLEEAEKAVIERRADRVFDATGGVLLRRYVSVSKTSFGEMNSEFWTDESGVLVRAKIDFTFGHMIVQLEEKEG